MMTLTVCSQASEAELVPERVADGTQAFMFESSLGEYLRVGHPTDFGYSGLKLTPWALESKDRQVDYLKVRPLERCYL